ncbi:lysophospholipid acyltransferase 6-like [Glandiceps talaboti]
MAFGFLIILADMAKVPIAEMIFPFLQSCSLILAIIYRHVLHPKKVSPTTRHIVATAIGLTIGFSCYSWSMLHLFLQSAIGYFLMKFLNRKYMAVVVFFVSMTYLSIEHLRKTMKDSSELLDHETPMMIMTMKITSVAFGLQDGSSTDSSNQHPKQRLVVIRRFPSIIEYFSYIFHFQTFIVGPFCFYTDYIDFIEGKHLIPYKIKTKDGKEAVISKEPSVMEAVLSKMMLCIVTATVVGVLGSSYTIKGVLSKDVLQSSPIAIHRVVYVTMAVWLSAFKYTFGFISAEVVCNASGFGFNGYDENGKPKWDLLTPIHFRKFMMSTDINDNIASWNITTVRWLKYVCYYRVPYYKILLTVLLSAVWHGFYPGYYWALMLNTFIGQMTSRRVHQYMNQFSIFKTTSGKWVYNGIFWILNTIYLHYMTLPFLLLDNNEIMLYYRSVYFCGHVISFLLICILPNKKTNRETTYSETSPSMTYGSKVLGAKKDQ